MKSAIVATLAEVGGTSACGMVAGGGAAVLECRLMYFEPSRGVELGVCSEDKAIC